MLIPVLEIKPRNANGNTAKNHVIKRMTPTEEEIKERNRIFNEKYKQVFDLLNIALEKYTTENCQCAFPRFQQLIGIDCCNYGESFKCWETEILISSSKKHFEIKQSDLTDENINEKWICKKCSSTYEYGWSDFSIYIERQKLKLTELKVKSIGKNIEKPIPLFLGLIGHSYPKRSEMDAVELAVLEKYLLEE